MLGSFATNMQPCEVCIVHRVWKASVVFWLNLKHRHVISWTYLWKYMYVIYYQYLGYVHCYIQCYYSYYCLSNFPVCLPCSLKSTCWCMSPWLLHFGYQFYITCRRLFIISNSIMLKYIVRMSKPEIVVVNNLSTAAHCAFSMIMEIIESSCIQWFRPNIRQTCKKVTCV